MVLQKGNCAICRQSLDSWDADHILEWSLGGVTETPNLQLLCKPCHKTKTRSFLAKDNKT